MDLDHKGRQNQPGMTDELARKQGPGRKRTRQIAKANRRGDKRSPLQKTKDANRMLKKKHWDIGNGVDYSSTDRSWLAVHHKKGKFYLFDRKGRNKD